MPGVPSSKGCDACRRQRKKCNQVLPACARCERLRIPCTGSGQQRYTFRDPVVSGTTELRAHSPGRAHSTHQVYSTSLVQNPTSATTRVSMAFVKSLEIQDIRYDVAWMYGPFMREIPKRLGVNAALDASADALASAFTDLRTQKTTLLTLEKYGVALKAARQCLESPVESQTAETMCAISMVMICQGLALKEQCRVNHSEGLAHLINAVAFRQWRDPFEVSILLTSCLPVIFESIFTHTIRLDPQIHETLRLYLPPEPNEGQIRAVQQAQKTNLRTNQVFKPLLSLSLRGLIHLPSYVHHPEHHLPELRAVYDLMSDDICTIRQMVDAAMKLIDPGLPLEAVLCSKSVRILVQCQAAFGLLLTLALIVNSILMALDPDNAKLSWDHATLFEEVIALTDQAKHYRPMGANFVTLCLRAAWAAADTPQRVSAVQAMVDVYREDFPSISDLGNTCNLRRFIENLHRDGL